VAGSTGLRRMLGVGIAHPCSRICLAVIPVGSDHRHCPILTFRLAGSSDDFPAPGSISDDARIARFIPIL